MNINIYKHKTLMANKCIFIFLLSALSHRYNFKYSFHKISVSKFTSNKNFIRAKIGHASNEKSKKIKLEKYYVIWLLTIDYWIHNVVFSCNDERIFLLFLFINICCKTSVRKIIYFLWKNSISCIEYLRHNLKYVYYVKLYH